MWVLLVSACADDPVSVGGTKPDEEYISETIQAFFDAAPRSGPPGYETVIEASCVARGSQPGIQQFYVRTVNDEQINYSVSQPDEDSLSVSIPASVTRRLVVSMRCVGSAGDVIEDELILSGYEPEIRVDQFPEIVLTEDTPGEVALSRDWFPNTQSLAARSLLSVLSVQIQNWETDPTLLLTPHSGNNGSYSLRLTADNSFGTTQREVPISILAATDIQYDLRVAGSLAPATTTMSWHDGGVREIGAAEHPPYMVGRQLSSLQFDTFELRAGEKRDVFFPLRRSFDVSERQDVLLLATLHPTQYCRSIFVSEANPLEACQALVREILFTGPEELVGYRPYPRPGSLEILLNNPETGASFGLEWLEAVERLSPLLAQHDIYLQIRESVGGVDYRVLDNGRLAFSFGSWVYPQTDIEPTGMPHRVIREESTDANGLPAPSGELIASSMALDFDAPVPDDQQLRILLASTAWAIHTGPLWEEMSLDQRQKLLDNVVSLFRFDDRTAWSIPVEMDIDQVMRVPE